MFPIIIEAALNFCRHQLQLPLESFFESLKKRTLIAYIDIEHKNSEYYRIFIGCDEHLIQNITEVFLGEESSDIQTLNDMLLETTNMIVGSAKVLAQESYNQTLNITTPFLSEGDISIDEEHYIHTQSGTMFIGLQRL